MFLCYDIMWKEAERQKVLVQGEKGIEWLTEGTMGPKGGQAEGRCWHNRQTARAGECGACSATQQKTGEKQFEDTLGMQEVGLQEKNV